MTARDVIDRNGWSLLNIAVRLVIVSMQYATLDSAQYNVPFTQLKLRGYRTCCMLLSQTMIFVYLYTCSGYGHLEW